MSKRTVLIILVSGCLVAAIGGVKRAFGPPVPLVTLRLIQAGMSEEDVRRILGAPTQVCPGGREYNVKGTNYMNGGQWTYTRPFVFGYVNVLFNTNRLVEFAHYEQF